jgi:hypothetical protein
VRIGVISPTSDGVFSVHGQSSLVIDQKAKVGDICDAKRNPVLPAIFQVRMKMLCIILARQAPGRFWQQRNCCLGFQTVNYGSLLYHWICGASSLSSTYQNSQSPLTGTGFWCCRAAEPDTCLPFGLPFWAPGGGKVPATRVTGGTLPQRTGSNPVRLLNARRAAHGTEVPPHGANQNTPRARSPRRSSLLLAASGQVQAGSHRERCGQARGVRRGVPD